MADARHGSEGPQAATESSDVAATNPQAKAWARPRTVRKHKGVPSPLFGVGITATERSASGGHAVGGPDASARRVRHPHRFAHAGRAGDPGFRQHAVALPLTEGVAARGARGPGLAAAAADRGHQQQSEEEIAFHGRLSFGNGVQLGAARVRLQLVGRARDPVAVEAPMVARPRSRVGAGRRRRRPLPDARLGAPRRGEPRPECRAGARRRAAAPGLRRDLYRRAELPPRPRVPARRDEPAGTAPGPVRRLPGVAAGRVLRGGAIRLAARGGPGHTRGRAVDRAGLFGGRAVVGQPVFRGVRRGRAVASPRDPGPALARRRGRRGRPFVPREDRGPLLRGGGAPVSCLPGALLGARGGAPGRARVCGHGRRRPARARRARRGADPAARRSRGADRLPRAGGGADSVAHVAAPVRACRVEPRPVHAPRAARASLRARRGGADPRVPRALRALGLARRAVGRRFHRAGETPPLRDDGFSRVVDDARGARAGGAPVARPTLADAVAAAGGARAGPGPARGARVRRPSAGVSRRVVRRPAARAAYGARGRSRALGPDEARRAARPAPPAARAAARRRGALQPGAVSLRRADLFLLRRAARAPRRDRGRGDVGSGAASHRGRTARVLLRVRAAVAEHGLHLRNGAELSSRPPDGAARAGARRGAGERNRQGHVRGGGRRRAGARPGRLHLGRARLPGGVFPRGQAQPDAHAVRLLRRASRPHGSGARGHRAPRRARGRVQSPPPVLRGPAKRSRGAAGRAVSPHAGAELPPREGAGMKLGPVALETTLAYRLWQAPFADKKLAPLFAHNDLRVVRRVLDVGCGPGTNTRHFAHADYLGVDINPRYIAYARRPDGRGLPGAGVTARPGPGARLRCVLVNSFLHHVDDSEAHRILGHLARLLTPDGHLHALELVLPPGRSVARLLARLDRGVHARPLAAWRRLLATHFEPVVFESYGLGALGMTLWHMVYFKGRARTR